MIKNIYLTLRNLFSIIGVFCCLIFANLYFQESLTWEWNKLSEQYNDDKTVKAVMEKGARENIANFVKISLIDMNGNKILAWESYESSSPDITWLDNKTLLLSYKKYSPLHSYYPFIYINNNEYKIVLKYK